MALSHLICRAGLLTQPAKSMMAGRVKVRGGVLLRVIVGKGRTRCRLINKIRG